jgi:AmmeMemoRadiSam system protein B/AmmeMemoRadiSam system protein A
LKKPFIRTFLLYSIKKTQKVNLLFHSLADILKVVRKVLFGLMALTAAVFVQATIQGVRPAVFAGAFYPGDRAQLEAEVGQFLSAARPAVPPSGRIIGLIAPHAGYVYSGRTAAAAYALVVGRQIDTVVIIGPSHHVLFEGCSVWPDGGFETPLGVAPVDATLAAAITRAGRFHFRPDAFAEEHSVEVQVPFVQKALPGAAIVPIIMGNQTRPTIRALAGALVKTCLAKNVLVVASTDLSHFLPKADAQATDARTAALIRAMDTETLIRKIEAGDNFMCGGGSVAALLLMAAKAGRPRADILARTDSSSFGGPIVGYLAAAVFAGEDREAAEFSLSPDEKQELLHLAKAAVAAAAGREAPTGGHSGNTKFETPRGVFVTLRKHGELRGCIGFIEPVAPLGQAIVQAATYAATEDPRFPPVKPAEVKDIKVEVSVLTPLREISDARKVEVGRHGLVVSRGENRGLLLPQVPVENGWDRETFLEQACLKAGLPPDAWRRGAKLFVFEAIVFGE